jgi:hypothetical protein
LEAEWEGKKYAFILDPLYKLYGGKYPFIQTGIVSTLDILREETQRLAAIYQRKLAALDELKKSFLHQAFAGQL